jgi:anthranilate synthase component 2
MKLLMIDNYDSFTYNIVQYFGELGADVEVFRNDEITIEGVAARAPDRLVISPGPCSPLEAGISVAAIQHFAGKLPILGVCLGHQSIGAAFGGKIIRAQQLMHGKTSVITTTQKGVFAGLPAQFTVNRYHSLAIERASCPEVLEITAWTEDGEIMGVRHKELAIEGVQFHPESILTEHGHAMLRNFLEQRVVSIETHQLLMFIAAGWLLNLTPGPDVLYIVSNALRSGTRAGIVAGLGITAGCFVHIFAAAVGVGALLATSATAFTVLKWLGAAYLLWMGVRMLFSRAGGGNECRHRRRAGRTAAGGIAARRVPGRVLDQCAQPQGRHLFPRLRAAVHRTCYPEQGPGLRAARGAVQRERHSRECAVGVGRLVDGAARGRGTKRHALARPRGGRHVHRLRTQAGLHRAAQRLIDRGDLPPCPSPPRKRCSAPSSTAKSSMTRCCTSCA